MTGKAIIEKNLKEVLGTLGVKDITPDVKISEKSENGDYYTNVALRLAGTLKKKPLDVAYELKDQLEKNVGKEGIIEKVEVAPPGFINFFFGEKALTSSLKAVIEDKQFGNSDSLKDRKIMVEYIDPNPFKEFHIGHLYVESVGESIARLKQSQGAQVKRVCYQGDVGLHVAKAIYGMQRLASETPGDDAELSLRVQFLGKSYAFGSTKYVEDEAIKGEINKLNKVIYEATNEEINSLYEKGRSWSLEYFDFMYARLGTKFEKLYFESEMAPIGLGLVLEYLKKGVFEESDGAVIFPGKKHGLHNRVFINSLGIPTYEAKEMALAPTKYKDFPYDESIIITGNEVDEYFRVVLKALEQIEPDLAKKTLHISHGMVRLPEGKMSSRTGNIITGEWLIDEVVSGIHAAYPDMEDATAEKVGLAAIKFALLKVGVGHDIEFNIEESIALSGASGPYLQYTYVRTQSLLAKSKGVDAKKDDKSQLEVEEQALLRRLIYFQEVVSQASEKYSPNLIAEYLLELSQSFNLFYQKHQVVGNEFRLQLTEAVGNVLANGLNLLGIETVERM